jgi:hypothetical protein
MAELGRCPISLVQTAIYQVLEPSVVSAWTVTYPAEGYVIQELNTKVKLLDLVRGLYIIEINSV